MRNYIILNDQNSNSISGLLIQSLAPISKPLMRTEIEEIDGRDGDITTKLGYSAYDKQITIGLFGNYDVDQVIAFFNSEGTAIFSNEPDKYYNYQIVDQIDFERLVRYKTATVTMHCQPFKYSTTEGADILSSSDNFATLNQSLNTDSSFYTYSSNVQADITATRQSGTGGKFFAVFTVPVVQGVNYHFSGNVSRNVSMYGYTDQLRGTSAGIAGKGFSGNFVYTATFTGTMVLGFYSNATTEIFIRNFAISNEAGTTISDEGTNLVLEGSQLAPFSQFDLKGNTNQTGTPTPDSPVPVKVVTGENVVKICGKNFLNTHATPNSDTLSAGGVSYAIADDGTIATSGTSTAGYKNIRFDITLPAGSYKFSGCPSGGTINSYSFALQVGSTLYYDYGSGGTFTLSGQTTIMAYPVRLGGDTGTNMNGLVFKPMITASTASQDYEAYQEQSFEVNLGKNMFDKSAVVDGYYINSGGTETASASFAISAYIPVDAGAKYSYSGSTNETDYGAKAAWYDGNKNILGSAFGFAHSGTITAPSGACYVRFSVRLQSGDADTFQLEKGQTVTPYSAFFTPIELCAAKMNTTDYGDYFYRDNGDWYIHKEIGKQVVDTSAIILRSNYTNVEYAQIPKTSDAKAYGVSGYNQGLLCTHAPFHKGITWNSTDGIGYIFDMAVEYYYWLGFVKGTGLDAIKTALGGCVIYYPLATPTNTKITNEALIEQLNDIDSHAHAYKERTHISSTYAEGNVPYIIAAAVTGDADGTVTNSGNIYSKPKLTIFGTGDIGVYLNGVQMFQIALGTSGYITIDTALMEAYQDNLQTLKNRQVTGDYSNFVLNPGDNQISFAGTVSMCVVENYSRWL